MGFRFICSVVLAVVLIFSFATASFAIGKAKAAPKLKSEILAQELDQKRQSFMKEQEQIRDQIRQLRKSWFSQRSALYAKASANPKDQSIKDEINKSKKDFYENKVALYKQLHQLRTDWTEERRDLFDAIRAAKKAELD